MLAYILNKPKPPIDEEEMWDLFKSFFIPGYCDDNDQTDATPDPSPETSQE